MYLALPYPAGMLDMSVWVCLPCHCVGVAMQISRHKASILISLRELCESHESSAVAHQWNLLQAQLAVRVVESADYSLSDRKGSSS